MGEDGKRKKKRSLKLKRETLKNLSAPTKGRDVKGGRARGCVICQNTDATQT